MLPSTVAPGYSISADAGGGGAHGLRLALIWWPLALLLSIGYFAFIFRHYRGKVPVAGDGPLY
jgi:hypothetical protein